MQSPITILYYIHGIILLGSLTSWQRHSLLFLSAQSLPSSNIIIIYGQLGIPTLAILEAMYRAHLVSLLWYSCWLASTPCLVHCLGEDLMFLFFNLLLLLLLVLASNDCISELLGRCHVIISLLWFGNIYIYVCVCVCFTLY
jgi:hypothetical protein